VTLAAAVLVGLIAGALGAWFVQQGELRYLRRELSVAQDRLLHAWREDKATIPPRPPEQLPPPPPLPPDLQEVVDDWEDPESRAVQESQIRQMMDAGWKTMAILKHLENQHP
jgi:hypothetical protein